MFGRRSIPDRFAVADLRQEGHLPTAGFYVALVIIIGLLWFSIDCRVRLVAAEAELSKVKERKEILGLAPEPDRHITIIPEWGKKK